MPLVLLGLVMTVVAIYSSAVAVYFNRRLREAELENTRLKIMLESKFD